MKIKLRQQLRARRGSLSATEHRHRSNLAAKAVAALPMFRAGKRVALYLPLGRETDTTALIAAARRRGVRVFVPVVIDRRHGRMRFHPLAGRTRRGAYGVLVPAVLGQPVSPRWLDLIVIPVVGVDAEGRRLGMGGGFYDRALQFRRRRRQWTGPHLVGFAFDCQRTESRFAEPWDINLDSLASESGLHRYKKGAP
jgi:5-formyltetrahydrofolate cyclo-ligase